MEADVLGQMRTGAATGVATKYLARADAKTAAIVGTGGQARTQLEAIAAVRKLERVRVYGRDASGREKFAREMSAQLNVPVEPVASSEEATEPAAIVCTATDGQPCRGKRLRPLRLEPTSTQSARTT
jgi:ornithine cyclodeaminase/alanine dehydrogenase-like protein (mu-crystallin family)